MGYRIKIKAVPSQGKAEKFSFDLSEGVKLALSGATPAMRVFSSFLDDPEATLCEITVMDGALYVITPKGRKVLLNGKPIQEQKLRPYDVVKVGTGKIEFLEVPVPALDTPEVSEEASTQFVQLGEEKETQPAPPPAKKTTPAAAPESATAMIMRTNYSGSPGDEETQAAQPQEKAETKRVKRRRVPVEEAPVESAMTRNVLEENRTTFTRALDHEHKDDRVSGGLNGIHNQAFAYLHRLRRHPSYPTWQSIVLSALAIGTMGEVFSWIAFGPKFEFDPIPSPYNALIAVAVCAVASVGFTVFAPRTHSGSRNKKRPGFESYFKTFAWYCVGLVPFGFAFYFPTSVVILAAALMGIAWTLLFGRKYFRGSEWFVPTSGVAWAGVIMLAFHFIGGIPFESPIHAFKAPELFTEELVLAPPQAAPATAEMSATPSKQEIAKEANTLSLDPLAQEQFFNAVKSGTLRLVRSMVDRKTVDPVFTLEHGSSALHFAAAQGDLSMVKYLLSKKVNIDAKDAGGTTPLMWATYHRHLDVVQYLLSKSADPKIRRDGGDRAIEIARRTHNDDLIQALEAATTAPAPDRSIASDSGHHTKKKKHPTSD